VYDTVLLFVWFEERVNKMVMLYLILMTFSVIAGIWWFSILFRDMLHLTSFTSH